MTTPTLNNKIETILQKYASIVEAVTEFRANTECQSCAKSLRNVLQKYSILSGGTTE